MPEQAHEGRAVLVEQINSQLNLFLSSIKTAIQNNLPNRNVLAETTLMGLLNLIHDWNLVNANSIRQNFPGIDLIDTDKKIGIQVTSTNTLKKVDNTLEKVAKLPDDVKLEHLHIMVITTDAPSSTMKERKQAPYFTGSDDIWNISTLLRQIMDLPIPKLESIRSFMDGELGTLRQKLTQKYLHLPLFSALDKDSFVGREKEMTEIRDKLSSGTKPIVLSGLGGMGKTELAVRFGKNYEEDKKGNVFFIRFEDSFTRTLAKMANGIRPKLSQDALSRQDNELCDMVLDILETCGENDILIIDNVDSEQGSLQRFMRDPAFEELMKQQIRVILTTRFDHDSTLIGVRKMDYDTLAKIFSNHGAVVSENDRKALIDAVDGHTLTVDQIARLLNGKGARKVTTEILLTALKNNTLPREKYRKIAMDYQQSRDQARIYENLSIVFNVSNIPDNGKAVLRCATLLPAAGMNSEYFLGALPEPHQDATDDLINHGWLNAEDGLLTIHPVIRLVCREELKPSDKNCRKFLNLLWSQYDETAYDRIKFLQMAELFANAANTLEDKKLTWLNKSGQLLLDLGEYKRTITLYENRLPFHKANLWGRLPFATAYNNMGGAYLHLGEYKMSLDTSQKAMFIRRLLLPSQHLHLATSYDNYGIACEKLGDYQEALKYQLKALKIYKKRLPPDHWDLAILYSNLGNTYGALDEHRNALEYKLNAYNILSHISPPNHPVFATVCFNLGITYAHLEQYPLALEFLKQALAIYEAVFPSDHPEVMTTLRNIAVIQSFQ